MPEGDNLDVSAWAHTLVEVKANAFEMETTQALELGIETGASRLRVGAEQHEGAFELVLEETRSCLSV